MISGKLQTIHSSRKISIYFMGVSTIIHFYTFPAKQSKEIIVKVTILYFRNAFSLKCQSHDFFLVADVFFISKSKSPQPE